MDSEVATKINEIRQRLDKIYEKKKGKASSGYVIGIFTTLQQSDISMIDTELRRDAQYVKEIKYVNVSDIKAKDFEKAVSDSTFCIYLCTEQKWKTALSHSDKKKILSRFGKKAPVVLLVDMLDSSDEEKSRIIKDQPKIKDYCMDLVLIRRIEEKPKIPQDVGFDRGASNSFRGPTSSEDGSSETTLPAANPDPKRYMPYRLPLPGVSSEITLPAANPDPYRYTPYRLPQPVQVPDRTGHQNEKSQWQIDRKQIVGIFSRSAEQDYAWLVRLLKEAFQDVVGEVKCFCITNDGYQQLTEDMTKCTFGILYHTSNRGRVNITNVKESLYDEELEALSAELGRKNTIVVIDDMKDSSEVEKFHILQTQPSIEKLTCDLILISVAEKENRVNMATKLKTLKYIFGGEYSSQKLLNSGRQDQHYPPLSPKPYPEPSYTERPDQHGPPSSPKPHHEPRYTGSPVPSPKPLHEPRYPPNDSGNASPLQSRERLPNAVPTPSKSTLAIFSRSEESDYAWLVQLLSSENLDVRSYKISPKDKPHEVAFQCKLVILYHNMHVGKLRLTDTKDAMYHEELEMLSSKFGKRRLIVVIDDLVDSDDKIKADIHKRQPSAGRFVNDIFLISMGEKKSLTKKSPTKDGKRLMDKINTIKEMLSK